MRYASRAPLGAFAVLSLVCLPLFAQEPAPKAPADVPKAAPAPAARRFDPSRRVPDYFGQIGLTPDQRETIYKARATHLARIEALEAEVAAARKAMQTDCEAVLTPAQKQLLDQRRQAAAESRAAAKLARSKTAENITGAAPSEAK